MTVYPTEDTIHTNGLDQLILEKISDQLLELDQRLLRLEGKNEKNPSKAPGIYAPISIANRLSALEATVDAVNQRAANMRLDRQFKLGFSRIFKRKT